MDARHPRDIHPDPVLTRILADANAAIDRVEPSRPRKRKRAAGGERKHQARNADAARDRDARRKPKTGRGSGGNAAEPVVEHRRRDRVSGGLDARRRAGGQRHGDPDDQRGQDPAGLNAPINERAGVRPESDGQQEFPLSAPARPFSHRPHSKWMYHYPDERNDIIKRLRDLLRAIDFGDANAKGFVSARVPLAVAVTIQEELARVY